MAEIQKVNYTHDALIDAIIKEPATTQRELAALFGYTEGWISQVMSSDAFKVRLAARRKEVVDPILIQTTEERLEGLAGQAMAVLSEKLSASKSPEIALKALDISTRALGYGARDRNQVNVQANFVVALPGKAQSGDSWRQEHRPAVSQNGANRLPVTVDTVIEVQSEAA